MSQIQPCYESYCPFCGGGNHWVCASCKQSTMGYIGIVIYDGGPGPKIISGCCNAEVQFGVEQQHFVDLKEKEQVYLEALFKKTEGVSDTNGSNGT